VIPQSRKTNQLGDHPKSQEQGGSGGDNPDRRLKLFSLRQ
jgi:hypothetical protein